MILFFTQNATLFNQNQENQNYGQVTERILSFQENFVPKMKQVKFVNHKYDI